VAEAIFVMEREEVLLERMTSFSANTIQVFEDRQLQGLILCGGLDGKVDLGHVLDLSRSFDPPHDLFLFLGRNLSFFNHPVQILGYGR
jgi:hypothetical protein